MDKKALAIIPRPEVTESHKELLLLVPHMKYLVSAQREVVGNTDTLIVNFFLAENGELKPEFRTFCQDDDYISQDLTTEKTKWRTGAIDSLTGSIYSYRRNFVVASVEDRKKILQFMNDFKEKHSLDWKQSPNNEVECSIDEYQNKIKEWRLKKKHEKEMLAIDEQMNKFGDKPADYEEFVKNTVFKNDNYIFYHAKKKKAYCTGCGKEFEYKKDMNFRHNQVGVCPCCKEEYECKSDGVSRGGLFAVQWSVLLQKYEDEILVRYFCHTKDFRTNYRKPKIQTYENYRTIHTAEKSKDYEWTRFKNTYNYRWCVLKNHYYGWQEPAETVCPRSAYLYNKDLQEAITGSCMKYSSLDIYVDKVIGDRFLAKPWCIDWYLNDYRKKPYLEQFLKVGFYKLTAEVLTEYSMPDFQHGRSILDTLEISNANFKLLREVGNPCWRDVCILKYGQNLSRNELDILSQMQDDKYNKWYEKYIDMKRYTTIYKLNKYIENNKLNKNDYFDYVRWLTEMEYDMRNDFNLYPKNFEKAHDEKSKEYIKFKDKKAKEDLKKFNKFLKEFRKNTKEVDALNLKMLGMFIRLPFNTDELKKEGESLHHCVGTYVDRVMKGETMIFFIRKEEEPDKPYFTLEYKNEKIVQCRGFKNCDMTPEVKAFTSIFEEKMHEYSMQIAS